jgi:hypothetical protein
MTLISTQVESDLSRYSRPTTHPAMMVPHGRRGLSGWKRTQKESTVAIAVRHLSKRYGTFQAVDDVSFDVPAGRARAQFCGSLRVWKQPSRARSSSPAKTPRQYRSSAGESGLSFSIMRSFVI